MNVSRRFLLQGGACLAASSVWPGLGLPAVPTAPSVELANGLWFDGERFRDRTMFAHEGRFISRRPRGSVETIDLAGKFVVPPFGEAHNHNLEPSPRLDELIRRYLREGIYYIKNANNPPGTRHSMADKIDTPSRPDVTYANGGITTRGGHPIPLAERNIGRGGDPKLWGDGGFYHIVDSEQDLERKWPRIVDDKPDFIKTYLQYSEEHVVRRDDPAFVDWRGLDPHVLMAVVRRAHGAGLRVATHIETAADFRTAVRAGVDEIHHLPGFQPDRDDWKTYDVERYRLSDADARLAAQNGTVIVPTVAISLQRVARAKGTAPEDTVRALLSDNLRTLVRHAVPIAVGSDLYSQTASAEFEGLQALGVFSNLQLLKTWCEITPRMIFPQRRIASFSDGFEASLLALDADPLEDLKNVQKISIRYKQGQRLDV
jgi:hypothetical protein